MIGIEGGRGAGVVGVNIHDEEERKNRSKMGCSKISCETSAIWFHHFVELCPV